MGINSNASYYRKEGVEGENGSIRDSNEIEVMSEPFTAKTTSDSGIGLSTPACDKGELRRGNEKNVHTVFLSEINTFVVKPVVSMIRVCSSHTFL